MANVSSSNGLEKRPKLRFPGFDEPYKQYRISDIYAERSQRGASDMELLSVTMNDGVVPRSEIEGKDNSSEDKSNYKVVLKGDMVYNSMRMWQGANGISPCDGIVSPAYTVLMPKNQISNGYFAALFKSPNLINQFRKNSQGMTSDTWNLKYPQIAPIKVCLPTLTEQEKIADMLGTLDKRIARQTQLVDSLKKYKRGLSSLLFSKTLNEGCRSISFANAFTLLQNNTFSRDDLSYDIDGVRNIHYGDVLIKYGTSVNIGDISIPCIKADRNIEKFSATSYLRNGDIVFADTAEDYTVGKATEIIGVTNQKVLSGLHTIPCRPHDSFAPLYLGYYFNSHYFRAQIFRMIQGIKVSSISKSEIVKTHILVPSYDEQMKIAAALNKVDGRIEREEATISALKKARCGLLQQLFI